MRQFVTSHNRGCRWFNIMIRDGDYFHHLHKATKVPHKSQYQEPKIILCIYTWTGAVLLALTISQAGAKLFIRLVNHWQWLEIGFLSRVAGVWRYCDRTTQSNGIFMIIYADDLTIKFKQVGNVPVDKALGGRDNGGRCQGRGRGCLEYASFVDIASV